MKVVVELTVPQADILELAARGSGDWAGPFQEFFWDRTDRYNPSLKMAYDMAMWKLRQAIKEVGP